ncbi:hypothetical protein M0R04_14320 [Candidatus Dojkabacteria bacterium]|jgi:hypothetical protein|nr:hypothetical protein [Candidatus Dojkabacteria bacterium]
MQAKPEHTHQDKIVGERFSTGENLLGEVKTAQMLDLICDICGQKTVKYAQA